MRRGWGSVGFATLLLLGCHSRDAATPDESAVASHVREGQFVLVPEGSELRRYLVIAAARRQAIQTPLKAPAALDADPAKVANILPPLSGRIAALHVHLGDAVKAGQPLFTIDSTDLAQVRSDLQRARIAQNQTRKALARAQDLVDHHIAAQKDLEQAQADDASARSEYQRASTVFRVLGIDAGAADSPRQLTVRSPLSGRVSALNAAAGTYANDSNAVLMTVSDVSTLWFSAAVQEKDLSLIRDGEEVRATVQSFPGETFSGKVAFIADQLDADTRTLKVRIAYDNADGRLKPGMFAEVRFLGPSHDAVLVPTTALVQADDQTVVFVEVSPWKFEPRTVLPGGTADADTEILKGLDGGERVVVKQGILLND